MDRYGFDLRSVRWYQGGLHDAGRRERMPPNASLGLDYRQVPDRSLNDMLVAGDLDAIISARIPEVHDAGDSERGEISVLESSQRRIG